jgi:flagellar protein FlgJ
MTVSFTGSQMMRSKVIESESLPKRTVPGLGAFAAAGGLSTQQTAMIWKAAQDFEAMAVGQLLQPMFETVDQSKEEFGGGAGEAAWQPMLVNEIARKISAAGGLGLAAPIFNQMIRAQEQSLQTAKNGRPAS